MENYAECTVETTVGVEPRAASAAETKKEWVAPVMRKFEIEEVTAAGGAQSSDAITSS
jgi:hypothetical protein